MRFSSFLSFPFRPTHSTFLTFSLLLSTSSTSHSFINHFHSIRFSFLLRRTHYLFNMRTTAFAAVFTSLLACSASARPMDSHYNNTSPSTSSASSLLERASDFQVYTRCQQSGHFALTFDDGPFKYNSKVVDHLDGRAALGSFFSE